MLVYVVLYFVDLLFLYFTPRWGILVVHDLYYAAVIQEIIVNRVDKQDTFLDLWLWVKAKVYENLRIVISQALLLRIHRSGVKCIQPDILILLKKSFDILWRDNGKNIYGKHLRLIARREHAKHLLWALWGNLYLFHLIKSTCKEDKIV